jgi:methyl-accepting chemotaxis protein
LESSLDGSSRDGYYDWQEGEQIRPKYMSIAAVPGTPLRVAATTYIEEFSQPASTFRLHLLLALVVVGLLAAAGAILIGRRISQPIGQMVGAAKEVANGDLAVEMPVTKVGELEQLAAAFAQMTGNLSSVIRQVRTLTLNLSSAAGQVVMTQRQHAANSGEQAAAVTSASAAVEELASSSAYIADTSHQVVAAASQTQANTQRGVEAMADAASRLGRISEGNQVAVAKVRDLGELARQIGIVMDLIEDIAAHTKLIAFNASIEASAAGEAGRRFAVVAAEVRHLAGNVAQSTEEIRAKVEQIQTTTNELIIASEKEQREIESGLTISGTMTDLLDQILDSAEQTTLSVEQISLSTQQQRTATEQLLGDLYPLTSSASTIAAGSQQTVDVMENLAAMARELQTALDRFHLPEVASTMANAE